MDFMPIFCDLKEKLCLVVGGGQIASHKAELLSRAQARLTIVAPTFNHRLLELGKNANVSLVQEAFSEHWLTGCWLVIAATDDPVINQSIYHCATQRQIFCNVVDDPQQTSFITPALIDHSPIIIALSTGGNAPTLSGLLRQEIESHLSTASLDPLSTLATLAGSLRQRVKNYFPAVHIKHQFWLKFFTDKMLINAVEHHDTLAINVHIQRLLTESGAVSLNENRSN